MRHTGAVRYVNGSDGSTIWQLGGKRTTFTDISSPATNFSFQHFARFVDGDLSQLTLFDNNGVTTDPSCSGGCSRGMHWELDHQSSTARLVQAYGHPQHVAVGAVSHDIYPHSRKKKIQANSGHRWDPCRNFRTATYFSAGALFLPCLSILQMEGSLQN